jgi:hypothetical protein
MFFCYKTETRTSWSWVRFLLRPSDDPSRWLRNGDDLLDLLGLDVQQRGSSRLVYIWPLPKYLHMAFAKVGTYIWPLPKYLHMAFAKVPTYGLCQSTYIWPLPKYIHMAFAKVHTYGLCQSSTSLRNKKNEDSWSQSYDRELQRQRCKFSQRTKNKISFFLIRNIFSYYKNAPAYYL